MEQNLSEELIISAAAQVHEDWCNQELKAFFGRAQEARKVTNSPGDALRQACYKGDQKRNEVDLDVGYLVGHETYASRCLDDFEVFKSLVDSTAIEVKRFANRDLTPEEAAKAGTNYKDGQENILRPFIELSSDSKKENLEAAIGAFNVYVQMSQAGISIEQMKNDPEMQGLIGVAIHTDWLKRNMDHPNDELKVPYSDLDEWTQQQDLTVFNALLNVVEKNKDRFAVAPVEGVSLPDYQEEERSLLGQKGK